VLWPLIIKCRQVLHKAVIPPEEIAGLPLMGVAKLRLWNTVSQVIDPADSLLVFQALDGRAFATMHVETLAPRDRVGMHHRMHHDRLLRPQDLLLLTSAGAGSPPGDFMHSAQSLQTGFGGLRQAVVRYGSAGEVRGASGHALLHRHFDGIEQRSARRASSVANHLWGEGLGKVYSLHLGANDAARGTNGNTLCHNTSLFLRHHPVDLCWALWQNASREATLFRCEATYAPVADVFICPWEPAAHSPESRPLWCRCGYPGP